MQITSVRSLITIFVTETMMKEYDMDRELWLIAYLRCRQIDRNCVVPYVFPSIHIYFFWKKKDSQGGSLSARSFDLARPGLAPPLSSSLPIGIWGEPLRISSLYLTGKELKHWATLELKLHNINLAILSQYTRVTDRLTTGDKRQTTKRQTDILWQ